MTPEMHEAVLRRDGHTCQAYARDFALDLPCSPHLHVHHVVLLSQGGGNDDMDILLTLCDAHHHHAHDVDRHGAEVAGIIRRR